MLVALSLRNTNVATLDAVDRRTFFYTFTKFVSLSFNCEVAQFQSFKIANLLFPKA